MPAPLPTISFTTALAWLRGTRKYMIFRGPHGYVILNHAGKLITKPAVTNGHAAMELYNLLKPQNVQPADRKTGRVFVSRQTSHRGLRSLDCRAVTS